MKQGLTVQETAGRLGVQVSTIRRWILLRKIAYCKVGERAVRIPVEEVERIVKRGYRPALIDL